MVKKYRKYLVGALLLLTLGVLGGGLHWLLTTPKGARWLVQALVKRTAGAVTVQQVEGRLVEELRLAGLQVEWQDGSTAIASLRLRWQPAALLRGEIKVTELAAAGVTLHTTATDRPEQAWQGPPVVRWPALPFWLAWLQAEVKRVHLQRLIWRRPDQAPLALDRVTGRLRWAGRRLELTLASRFRELAGGPGRLDLTVELQPAPRTGYFAGSMRLHAVTVATGGLRLASRIELAPGELMLRDLALTEIGAAGRLSGRAGLRFVEAGPELDLDLTVADWNLAPQFDLVTDLSGRLRLTGNLAGFQGSLEAVNRAEDWRAAALSSPFAGSRAGLDFTALRGRWLDGALQGTVALQWQGGLEVRGQLDGEGFDTGRLHPAWPGHINLVLDGRWWRPETGPPGFELSGQLRESTLRGKTLQGRVDGRLQGDDLDLAALELVGDGVTLSAAGRLRERLAVQLAVRDLTGLLPESAGALQARGWVRRQHQRWSGTLHGQGQGLRFREVTADALELVVRGDSAGMAGEANLVWQGLRAKGLPAVHGNLQVVGTPERHQATAALRSAQGSLSLAAGGGYRQGRWQGRIDRLQLEEGDRPWHLRKPVEVAVSPRELKVDALALTGREGEELQLAADLVLQPLRGRLDARWRQLDLARANPYLAGMSLTGRCSGRGQFDFAAAAALVVNARAELSGRLQYQDLTLKLTRGAAQVSWNRTGLSADLDLDLDGGGRLTGLCRSEEPGRLAVPTKGDWSLTWESLDMGRLQPWLPPGLAAAGQFSGRAQGSWAPGGALTATGQAAIRDGLLEWRAAEGQVSLPLRTAEVAWDWQGPRLEGQLALALSEAGHIDGRFRLPLPARLPLAFDPEGPLQCSLQGRAQEWGLVGVLFPGVLQESHGQLEVELAVGGSWRQPTLSGRAQLAEAGAYLPAAGIELREAAVDARLEGNRIRFSSFSVRSGEGQLRGEGFIRLQDWRPVEYQATLDGERFMFVNLPELQMLAEPRLTLSGTPQRLSLSGTVVIPELTARGGGKKSYLGPSEDVVMLAEEEAPQEAALAVDAKLRLILGDGVRIDTENFKARLVGELELQSSALQAEELKTVTATGRIAVAEGSYNAYGARLEIARGNFQFNGGPVQEPTLDILALRTVGKVKAGVRVTGTPAAPIVELYSEPPMADSDRLAYIVLGSPMAKNPGEADLLMSASAALLSQGEASAVQEQIKSQLGIDVLGVEAGEDDTQSTMLVIGKYLQPNLYLSYGQSLYTDSSELRLRYGFGERWEVESKTGTESGVDLYYKIEFR